jgi:16S rRNA processing protein RimM
VAEPPSGRLVTAGRVGRPHGLDGSFKVLDAVHGLPVGTTVRVGERDARVRTRRGTDQHPIVALEGVDSREAAAALGGALLLVAGPDAHLADDEWLAEDLIGCEVDGLGPVVRVLAGPSCDVLELGQGTLVPLIGDAVLEVDTEARRIRVNRAFLGLEPGA